MQFIFRLVPPIAAPAAIAVLAGCAARPAAPAAASKPMAPPDPLTHAAKISQPLRMVQGKNDPRVPWTASEQIVHSLRARNAPVRYLLADNEGHDFARRENDGLCFPALPQCMQQTVQP